MTVTATRTPRTYVTTRKNECANPSFTVDDAGWSYIGGFGTGGAGTQGRVAVSGSAFGAWGLRKTWTTAPTAYGGQEIGFRYALATPGTVTRTFTARVATSWATVVQVKAYLYSDAGATVQVGAVSGATVNTSANASAWARPFVTVPLPAGVAVVRFQLHFHSTGALPPSGATMTMQTAMIDSGSDGTAEYFDGDTYPAGGGGVNGTNRTRWAGTAGASQSLWDDYNPADVAAPDMVLGYDTQRPARNTIHTFLSGAVGMTQLPGTLRTGTLRLFFTDPAKAATAEAVLGTGAVFTFADTDWPAEGMLFTVGPGAIRSYQDDSRRRRILEVPYAELTP